MGPLPGSRLRATGSGGLKRALAAMSALIGRRIRHGHWRARASALTADDGPVPHGGACHHRHISHHGGRGGHERLNPRVQLLAAEANDARGAHNCDRGAGGGGRGHGAGRRMAAGERSFMPWTRPAPQPEGSRAAGRPGGRRRPTRAWPSAGDGLAPAGARAGGAGRPAAPGRRGRRLRGCASGGGWAFRAAPAAGAAAGCAPGRQGARGDGSRCSAALLPAWAPASAAARGAATLAPGTASARRCPCARAGGTALARQRSRFSVKASAPCIAEPAPSMTRPSVRRAAPTGLSIMVTGSRPPRGGPRAPVRPSARPPARRSPAACRGRRHEPP